MLCFAKTSRAFLAFVVAPLFASTGAATARAQQQQEAVDLGPSMRVHLQETRTRLEEIHSDLRRMQTRLKLAGAAFEAEPQADIAVSSAMSSEFVVTGLQVWLDGASVYEREDDKGVLHADLHVLSGPIAAGDHVARITVRLRGDGAIFPYMRGYRFEVRSNYRFNASPGQIATVCVRAFERGNPITPYVQLPAIEWSDRPFLPRS
jgi:hypothetical protein